MNRREKRPAVAASTCVNQHRTKPSAAGGPFSSQQSRRAFLGRVGGLTAATTLTTTFGSPALIESTSAEAAEIGPLSGQQRRNRAYQLRHHAALQQKHLPLPDHPTNGDEELYQNQIGSFSKALPHNSLGEVDLNAYHMMIRALTTGRPADFEAIPLGGPRRLVNPQAALAFELEGPDSHHLGMPAAPAFSSAETAGEMVELYWHALLRDVHFSEYDANPLTNRAAMELSALSDFRGAKVGGQVTPATLFRADIPGVLEGPYVSQFLLRDVPFGPQLIGQQMRTVVPNVDYLTAYANWLAIQNGAAPGQQQLDPVRRYIRNGRDLARWVQVDVLFQAYFNALLIMLATGVPFDGGNAYLRSRNQSGMGVLGPLHIQSLVAAVATRAFKAIWYQKWSVHRRLRPEMFGGRIHNDRTGAANYPIHSDVLTAPVLNDVVTQNGTYLLPQAFVEGSPTHPSYAAGHAGIAGACVTVLKAFFDESFIVPNAVVASTDGLGLIPYEGPPLSVGGELNKLGWNIAMGRDFAGIHYRSDQIESMRLGEEVAIRFLQEERLTYNEDFDGFSLTKFDGTTISV